MSVRREIAVDRQGCHTCGPCPTLLLRVGTETQQSGSVKAYNVLALRSPTIMPAVRGKRKQPETTTDVDLAALHRARIVDWSPTAVTALAASADGTVVAAARESGSIEIWSTAHWQCIKVMESPEVPPLPAALRCMCLNGVNLCSESLATNMHPYHVYLGHTKQKAVSGDCSRAAWTDGWLSGT